MKPYLQDMHGLAWFRFEPANRSACSIRKLIYYKEETTIDRQCLSVMSSSSTAVTYRLLWRCISWLLTSGASCCCHRLACYLLTAAAACLACCALVTTAASRVHWLPSCEQASSHAASVSPPEHRSAHRWWWQQSLPVCRHRGNHDWSLHVASKLWKPSNPLVCKLSNWPPNSSGCAGF
jgi:hypothetical protein